MDPRSLLNDLCRTLSGAHGALMLDAGGEVVAGSDASDDRLRLIGAYQGIALATAHKTAQRYAGGAISSLVARHASGTVISRPLKDGYYLIIALAPEAPVALAEYRSTRACELLNDEI